MKFHSSHAVAGVTLAILAATITHLSGTADPYAATPGRDPSVPPASVALSGAPAAEGNVQDLTY